MSSSRYGLIAYRPRSWFWLLIVLLGLGNQTVFSQELPILGPAPRLDPDEAPVLLRGPYSPGIKAITFDPMVRSSVANAYTSIYVPQGSVAIGWTGNLASCLAGSTSTQYRQATIDRVNYYRTHVGLPGNITLFGGTQATGTQQAALMFSANQALSHTPPGTWTCYTTGGATAASKSNIALGFGSNAAAGPSAVNLYMDDSGSGNAAVGHRRWILYPRQLQMDSGSMPYVGSQYAANALWVISSFGARPPTPNGVVWPPRGYVPWQILPSWSNRWSFSWPDANFSSATVTMTRDGVPLAAPAYEPISSGYADNTLVWRPQGVTYSRPATDTTYRVTINGISGGGAPPSISYDVVVIDPFTGGPVANQPPTITALPSIPLIEDVASALSDIVFADPDAGMGSLTATFSVPKGTLSATSTGGVSVTGTATTRSLSGTLVALNAYIASAKLSYKTALDDTTSSTLSISINDNGNTGSGGAQGASCSVALTVQAVNDAPSIRAPARLAIFAAGTAPVNGVSFADVDADSGSMTVSLSAPGSVTLSGSSSGGVSASGSGNSRTFTGDLAALNNYFAAGTARMSGPGFGGSGNLSITINDNGHSGSGGNKSSSATITLYAVLFADGFE